MNILSKILSFIFSLMIIGLALVVLLSIANIISVDVLVKSYNVCILGADVKGYAIISAAVIGILGVICIAGLDSSKNKIKSGLILNLEEGSLNISNQTFENIVLNIVRKYSHFRNVKVNVAVEEQGLFVELLVYIMPNTIVADVMQVLGEDIKKTVIKQTTVEVKEVNVKVKGVYDKVDKVVE